MKRKIIAIILGVTIMLTVVACGKKEETAEEMLDMINNQEAITIEIAEPLNQEQGTTIEWDWEALAKTQTHPEFREKFDDILSITAHGKDGKNGVLYVDPAGNHTNDSTLRYAFQNKKFIDNVWNNTETTKQLIDLAKETFTDVETDQEALIAAINAYYNLILDSEPGYANLNSTVTRIEAMATVNRADTPINDIFDKTTYSEEFDVAIGYHEYSLLAQELVSQNYLDYKNQSLDAETANNTITRAEFIYLLVQRYYSDEYATVTGKEDCYSDCKNGGNIALDVGFITKDESTGEITYTDRWQSSELSYALNDSKVGMPDDLYKAMVVAKNHNLITGNESSWNTGLTKGDAINLIINVYEDLGTTTNAECGVEFNLIEMDAIMYATGNVNVRCGISAEYDKLGGLTTNEEVHVTGQSETTGWYEIEFNGVKGYVSNNYLSASKVEVAPPVQSNPSQPSGGGLITDPNYKFNLDPSIWGDVDTGNFGGGGQLDSGVTLH